MHITPKYMHDSQIDLSLLGIISYRYKKYFGSECRGVNGTVDRAMRNHKFPIKSINRNLT